MSLNHSIDNAFSKEWSIGGALVPCRYRYRESTHTIKSFDGLKKKGVICISPDGLHFEVIDSVRMNVSTYQHTIQPVAQEVAADEWSMVK